MVSFPHSLLFGPHQEHGAALLFEATRLATTKLLMLQVWTRASFSVLYCRMYCIAPRSCLSVCGMPHSKCTDPRVVWPLFAVTCSQMSSVNSGFCSASPVERILKNHRQRQVQASKISDFTAFHVSQRPHLQRLPGEPSWCGCELKQCLATFKHKERRTLVQSQSQETASWEIFRLTSAHTTSLAIEHSGLRRSWSQLVNFQETSGKNETARGQNAMCFYLVNSGVNKTTVWFRYAIKRQTGSNRRRFSQRPKKSGEIYHHAWLTSRPVFAAVKAISL